MERGSKTRRNGLLALFGLIMAGLIVTALLWANSGTPSNVNNREEPTSEQSSTADR